MCVAASYVDPSLLAILACLLACAASLLVLLLLGIACCCFCGRWQRLTERAVVAGISRKYGERGWGDSGGEWGSPDSSQGYIH
jgi:hypothetical protein